jgi:ParB family chromosome partitioning protein
MSKSHDIQPIPINKIIVLNPRERSPKSFDDLKDNIKTVGLKKPITVRPSEEKEGHYELVCGEGRLKSYIANNHKEIPAIIRTDLLQEDAYVMSLVENMARRRHSSVDLMKGISLLDDQGYGVMDISRKTGLANSYVSSILTLLKQGEERLVAAVERGDIPLTIATKIASSPDNEQQALQDAYESEELRGAKFVIAKRLIEKRRTLGKGIRGRRARTSGDESLSARQMVQKFKTELDRMRILVEKANKTENTLMIATESFYKILQDDNYRTLLRAENIVTMPADLTDMINEREKSYDR